MLSTPNDGSVPRVEAGGLKIRGTQDFEARSDSTADQQSPESIREDEWGSPQHKEMACENPTCAEIADCCNHLKVPNAIEIDKAYPRDFMQRGRVRVQLKKEDGTLSNPAIPTRKQLMLQVAELVPRHPGRTKKQEAPSTSSTAGSSKSGKGGRKKR
ncbi:hypothetical protein V6N12_063582 [Hibiscus sabdariffa]|uniref:Signal recognition particle 19 kDa protein n=1 Tax=Hibiscus sabdariffa TaxID=183260 RepID=A0ABR2FC79_9ROSI